MWVALDNPNTRNENTKNRDLAMFGEWGSNLEVDWETERVVGRAKG